MKTLNILFAGVISLCCLVNSNAQIKVYTNNKVGIGIAPTNTAKNTLDVNGNIQISNASIPMGLMTEVGGTTPLLNLSVNFREPNKIYSYLGGAFRIDTRNTSSTPLFQWIGKKASGVEMTLMVLNISGQLGIGKIPSCSLDVAGTIMSNGVVVTSDSRLKENIAYMNGSLSTLTRLRGVTYNLKPLRTNASLMATNKLAKTDSTGTSTVSLQGIDSVFYSRNHIGFLAQEVQTVYPELVYENKDGVLSVDYISIIPVLVEAMKEQQGQFSKLKEELEALKQENEKLKKKVGLR